MRRYITFCLILFGYSFGIRTAAAQWFAIGVKGGVSLTDALYQPDQSRRYLVGPSLEFRVGPHFAVEVDAIYQRIGYTYTSYVPGPDNSIAGIFTNRARGNSWQFPVLGKYYFRSRRAAWRPFVSTGYAFGTTWFHSQGQSSILSGGPILVQVPPPFVNDYRSNTNVGAVFAAGVRFRKNRFSVLPEFRFTHWGQGSYTARRNQGSFLLGISF